MVPRPEESDGPEACGTCRPSPCGRFWPSPLEGVLAEALPDVLAELLRLRARPSQAPAVDFMYEARRAALC